MAAEPIDFLFDFLSPFAYLAHDPLVNLAERYGRTLRYLPIVLPRAKLAAGNTGPANREGDMCGVFGVPTMMIGTEMWWGNDRLGFSTSIWPKIPTGMIEANRDSLSRAWPRPPAR